MNTTSMSVEREFHTGTLLGNGKVLAAGGWSNGGVLSSAELYDPATRTWSGTGSMSGPRYYHTATLLANGKVLVVGGWSSSSLLATAALYDPTTGLWSNTGSLNTARYWHTATLLPNGKVLVTGGLGAGSALLSSAELYDPSTGNWSVTGSMGTARHLHTATLLSNGKVLIAAGASTGGGAVATAELYTISSGTWAGTGSMSTSRHSHAATMLVNGKVLVTGGWGGGSPLSSAVLYDPAAGTWSATGSMITGRYYHTPCTLPDGSVLVLGGYAGGSVGTANAEIYTPALGTWAATGSMNIGRYDHSATPLGDGRILVAGGGTASYTPMSNAEIYVPLMPTWTTTGSLGTARDYHTATLLGNGKILVAGGIGSSGYLSSSELYDPATGTWSATSGSLNTGRAFHTATMLPNGKVLIVGGSSSSSAYLSSAELFDPATGTWSVTGSIGTARRYHTATLLRNGKVLITGGQNNNTSSTGILLSAELYTPSAGTWAATGSMANRRQVHTASLLDNGKVLVAGGWNWSGYPNTAELYDPGLGTWSNTGALGTGRYVHTANVLTNGKVLVAGGYNGNFLASCELYNPSSGTWSYTGSLNTGREFHTSTLLVDGSVMVAAGDENSGGHLTSVELYNPVAGTWARTAFLNTARYLHTATLMANGKVLVAGGYGFSGYLSSCEVYAPLLVDPKLSGGRSFSSVVYASTGTQYISKFGSPTSGYSISRRLDISPFYNFLDSFWGFGPDDIPINGNLRVPSGSGPFPLALFVHGNHDPTDFSDEGYIYLCELLASWGVLAASIDANFYNGGNFGENGARGILHLEHVRQFEIWNGTSGHPLYGKVDFNNVMIVGHSRGGEGVGHASYYNTYAGSNPVALDGSAGLGPYAFNLTAVVAIAPTDGQYTPPEGVQPVRDNYLIIHGSRDGDVSDFQGYFTYDRAHPIDISPPIDNAEGYKALAYVIGANHNYFNSAWGDESWGTLLTRAQQEDSAKVYIGSMAQAMLLGRTTYLEFLKNHDFGKSWLPATQFISQYQEAIRQFIDHYEEDSNTSTLSPPTSGANTWSAASFSEMFFFSWPYLYQETYGAALSWSASSHYYQAAPTSPGVNAGGYPYWAIRIGQSTESQNPSGADQNVKIYVQDATGGSTFFLGSAFSRLLYPDTFTSRTVMQTLRMPLSLLRERGVNVNGITVVKLMFDQVSTGKVYFDDLQVSK